MIIMYVHVLDGRSYELAAVVGDVVDVGLSWKSKKYKKINIKVLGDPELPGWFI